jgi:hypothetical protein
MVYRLVCERYHLTLLFIPRDCNCACDRVENAAGSQTSFEFWGSGLDGETLDLGLWVTE